jgi:hypothetical protein
MEYVGTCPSCETPVSLGVTLVVAGSCRECGASFTVLAFEVDEGTTEGEVPVTLLPRSPGSSGTRPLPRSVHQFIRLFLVVLATFATAFVFLAILFALESGGTLDEASGITRVIFSATLGLVTISTIGTVLLWFLLGAKGREDPAFDAVRSLFAVAGGFLMMLAVRLVFTLASPIVEGFVSLVLFAVAVTTLSGLLGGWVIARLAPIAPFKHALAVAIAIPLAAAGLLGIVGALGMTPYALVYLAYLPAILAGAWLRVR